jgi:hypothetical protein
MAQPNITFIEGSGGLGRPLESKDHISGYAVFSSTYATVLPSGFTTTARVKALYSADDAVAAGIVKDYSDGTSASGSYAVTAVGSDGNTVELKVADLNPLTGASRTISLGVYTKVAGDTTTTLVATAIKNIINSGTATHGYTATSSTATVTIVAPKSMGSFLNTVSMTATYVTTGTAIAGTIVAFTGGASSQSAIHYYHISEFFRMQPKGILYVGLYNTSATYTEITDMQTYATGSMRQVAVFKDGTWASGDITILNAIAVTNKTNYKPLSILYAGNLVATADITTVTDFSTSTTNLVTSVISQDGGGKGHFLFESSLTGGAKKSITNIGTALGTIALAKVSESIAWVGKFNISDGVENEIVEFCNGQLWTSLSQSALEALFSKRHLWAKKFTGVSGTFWVDSSCAVATTSDYAYIENNRTICKAERNLYTAYTPLLNSPITFNANGTITDNTIAYFENVGNAALDQMVKDNELSAKSVTINPTQNVLSTSTLTIAVTLVINGVARIISIPIGFKPSIA